jgi:hypothetical protein
MSCRPYVDPIQVQQQFNMLVHYTNRCLDLPTYVRVRRFARVQGYRGWFLVVNNWKTKSKPQFPYSWFSCYFGFKNHPLDFVIMWDNAPYIDHLHRSRSISERRCGAAKLARAVDKPYWCNVCVIPRPGLHYLCFIFYFHMNVWL